MAPDIPNARNRWIQVVAVAALVWGLAYMIWRVGWTGTDTNPALFWSLLIAEAVGLVNLGFYTFLAWTVPNVPSPPVTRERTVDVLVPTYDESVEVLRATLVGCRALRHPHTTWLLDDGRRPEMAELAEELGVKYLTRPDNAHAKAGNINHALGHLEGELVAILDADHVPLPHFLDAMVGHFDDPEVALVQAPHEFYNLDSVQHIEEDRHEQSLFFRIVCPGKDRHNGVFWCGSGTVARREPLMEIGGVQTATIAEDFHTTICLHQRGWRTHYVNETLLLGLAPHDLDAFLLQRSRWARGNLRVFLTAQNPVWARHLTLRQRLSYLGSLLHYFGGPQRVVLAIVLAVTLVTGSLPLRGDLEMFLVLWMPWVVLSLAATKLLARGTSGLVAATRHGWMTVGVYTTAALSLLLPFAGTFKVTPKTGHDDGGLRNLGRLRLLTTATVLVALALVARLGAIVGLVDLPDMPLLAEIGTTSIAAVELTVVTLILRSLVQRRQRRNTYRFAVHLPAVLDGEVRRVVDLNHRGASVLTDQPHEIGEQLDLTITVPSLDGGHHDVTIEVVVRSVQISGDGLARMGLEFVDLDDASMDRILEFCHVLLPATNDGADTHDTRGIPDQSPTPTPDSPGSTAPPVGRPDTTTSGAPSPS